MERNKFTPEQEAWLSALESGNYKQGKGRLFHYAVEKFYCCLGVATQVLVPDHWALRTGHGWDYEDLEQAFREEHYDALYSEDVDGMRAILEEGETCPPDILWKLQLYDTVGSPKRASRRAYGLKTLVSYNDADENDGHLSFPEIAALLRAHPGAYFTNFDEVLHART